MAPTKKQINLKVTSLIFQVFLFQLQTCFKKELQYIFLTYLLETEDVVPACSKLFSEYKIYLELLM